MTVPRWRRNLLAHLASSPRLSVSLSVVVCLYWPAAALLLCPQPQPRVSRLLITSEDLLYSSTFHHCRSISLLVVWQTVVQAGRRPGSRLTATAACGQLLTMSVLRTDRHQTQRRRQTQIRCLTIRVAYSSHLREPIRGLAYIAQTIFRVIPWHSV